MLQRRAVVVFDQEMLPVELVVRGNLTGTGYLSYKESGVVCGHELPPSLQEGATLQKPIFTPTTKAHKGHDMPRDYRDVEKQYDGVTDFSVSIFETMHAVLLPFGIMLVDTKWEVGYTLELVPRRTTFVLSDERATPDSSRFWYVDAYDQAMKKGELPSSADKQVIRDAGKKLGIDTLDSKNPEHRERVLQMKIPPEVIRKYKKRTNKLFKKFPEQLSLRTFQEKVMKIY